MTNLDPIDHQSIATAIARSFTFGPSVGDPFPVLDARHALIEVLTGADDAGAPDPDNDRKFALGMLEALDEGDDDVKAILKTLPGAKN